MRRLGFNAMDFDTYTLPELYLRYCLIETEDQ
jgi:hypothetical protein